MFLVTLLALSSIALSVEEISASPVSQTATVSMMDNFFDPTLVNIDVGDTVQWDHGVNGNTIHTTTANGGAWDSASLDPGGSFSQYSIARARFRRYAQSHCMHHWE